MPDGPPFTLGRARRVFPRSTCDTSRGYLPYTYFDCDYFGGPGHSTNFPHVNTWTLLTAGRASFSNVKEPGDPVDPPLFGGWVISHYLAAEPLRHEFAPGCRLLPKLDSVLLAWPRSSAPLPPHLDMGAWSQGSTAFLLIRPPPITLGHSFFIQWVEYAPGENLAGLLTGHAVQLEIGNATLEQVLPQ